MRGVWQLSPHYKKDTEMAKVNPKSRTPEVLENTIREMLQKPKLFQPLFIGYLHDALEMFHFDVILIFSKRTGKYLVTNYAMNELRHFSETKYDGDQFIIVDHTIEMALARAIHYYYHSKR